MNIRNSAGVWVLAVVILLVSTGPVAAGLFEWSPLGRLDNGGDSDPAISAIATHPTDPDILLAGARLTTGSAGLVYRSTDGGATWERAAAGLPDNLPLFSGVNDLLFMPGAPDILYAGLDGGGIWRSDDGGDTWEEGGRDVISANETVIALAAATGPIPVVYALTPGGVFASSNGGTWVKRSSGLPSAVYLDLAIDPTAPQTLYVATNPAGLYRTVNGGGVWSPANGNLPGGPRNVREVSVNPHTGEVFASLRGAGLFRSADGGVNWTLTHSGITYATSLYGTVGAPEFCPSDPLMAYVFNSDGIFRSVNGGAAWSPYAVGFTGAETITQLAFHAARPHTIFAGTAVSGIWDLTIAEGGRYFVPVIRR